jgi:hypothetical protein
LIYCVGVHICLSFPSAYLSIIMLCFSSYFHPLHSYYIFISSLFNRFFVSFAVICFLSPRFLFPSYFVSCVLFAHLFLLLSPYFIRLSQILRFTLTFILFSFCHSVFLSLVSFLYFSFPFVIFLAVFFPWWFATQPNLYFANATMWHLHTCYVDLLAWIEDGTIVSVIFQN